MDSMEVECKRKDGSWRPCQISLSEGNAAIIVAYENSGEGEEDEEKRIDSKEEGLSRLRFRSAFLQGCDCSRVKEGQSVLALHDSSSSNLFFDAIVEKINKVRHSDRLACRCTFQLKWLPTHLSDQKVRAPSTCIMQLSDKNIETHPVFEAFMASKNSRAEMEISAFDSPLRESLFEVDLDGLLEKQVQEIIMAQGGDCSEDVIVELKKAKQKELKTKKSTESNSGRRVTRSKSKQEIEPPVPVEEAIEKSGSRSFLGPEKATEKDVTSSFLSPGEATEKGGTRSFLSPLAARAALASLMSTRPVTELPKQPGKLYVSPETSKAEIARFPLLSPLAARASLALFASEHPASGLPKQAKKPPLTPNQSDYNSKPGKRQTVNPDSEKVDYVIPRRVTRSAVKKEGVDQIAEIEGLQKARGTKKSNRESGNSSFTPDVDDVVTPAKIENKKRIGISPSASSATNASVVTNTISYSEDDTCQDSESQTVAKRRKVVSRKPPTRFSPRLAQLDK